MSNKNYIEDRIKEYLKGKTPEEAGLSEADLKKLIGCYEGGIDPTQKHFRSVPDICACNICRS